MRFTGSHHTRARLCFLVVSFPYDAIDKKAATGAARSRVGGRNEDQFPNL
jgi:hypothetical protein